MYNSPIRMALRINTPWHIHPDATIYCLKFKNKKETSNYNIKLSEVDTHVYQK